MHEDSPSLIYRLGAIVTEVGRSARIGRRNMRDLGRRLWWSVAVYSAAIGFTIGGVGSTIAIVAYILITK